MNHLPAVMLDDYRPPVVRLLCERCERDLEVEVAVLRAKFGNVSLGEAARRVADRRGCALAVSPSENLCSVRVEEPPFHHWARLDDARRLGWRARIRCLRHMHGLKRTRPCPGVWELDWDTLVAVLGYDFPLHKLAAALSCPDCHTKRVDVQWIEPPVPARPGGAAAAPIAPTRATKTALRAIAGGRRH